MLRITERPALRHTWIIETPDGHRARWAKDAPEHEDRPSDRRWSSTMPGGYENASGTLRRDPRIDYPDPGRLSDVKILDCTGEQVGEYRLEDTPRVSGDRFEITPQAVGWQAQLDDDKSAGGLPYVDRELPTWQAMSATRRAAILATEDVTDASVAPDRTGIPELRQAVKSPPTSRAMRCESLYYSETDLADLYYEFVSIPGVNVADANWLLQVASGDDDSWGGEIDESGNLRAASGAGYVVIDSGQKVIMLLTRYAVAVAGTGIEHGWRWRNLAVYADHGLTKRGATDPKGFYDSDVIAHAVGEWCPLLNFTTTGPEPTIQQGDFVIPHLTFPERTTVAEIVRAALRFSLRDYAVWNDRMVYLHPRGARARRWITRVADANLEETGPSVKRLWESILVEYRDVDGTTRTVGPLGSGADTEDALLKDDDPDNPANQLGMTRRDKLVMQTATAASAAEVGARFLEQAKLVDGSGRAKLSGWVEDDRGNLYPYSQVQAGDELVVANASDSSPRHIVKADHAESDDSVSVDLDAPPDGLAALLERLQVRLVPLGL